MGIAGFIYSGHVIFVPYRTSDAGTVWAQARVTQREPDRLPQPGCSESQRLLEM